MEITAAQAIQIGHFAKRGGVEKIDIYEDVSGIELIFTDLDGKTLGGVILGTDGQVIYDSQAK